MERIENADDPRLDAFRDVRERDLVGRRGLFIAEGEVVVRRALAEGLHPLQTLLLADDRLEKLADLIAEAPPDLAVLAAPQDLFDRVAGFPIHRGILALGRRGPDPGPERLLASAPERALVVAALDIGNHDNLGGIFRNAAAFGAHAVLLGAHACDPLYRKAIRVSVGAALSTPFARLEDDAALPELLAAHGFTAIALSPGGVTPLSALRRPARTALILGAEGPGLPEAILSRCQTVSIPMRSGFDSLNVATAGGIALHHLA